MATLEPIMIEEFQVGMHQTSSAHEVTADEIREFARKYDPQPFHLDEEIAKQTPLGGLCASGWHTCAIVMGLVVREFMKGRSSLGSPGVDEIRWRKPVYAGDSIRLVSTVGEIRMSRSKPGLGTVHFDYTVLNQRDETVMTMKAMALFPSAARGG